MGFRYFDIRAFVHGDLRGAGFHGFGISDVEIWGFRVLRLLGFQVASMWGIK